VRIAVSGATGFIGRHVIAELERRSLPATLICRSSPIAATGSSEKPADLVAVSRHTIVHLDMAAPPVDAFDAIGRPDTLIHLAWGGLPNYKSPHHLDSELPAQFEFLKSLISAGLKKCVVAGTCLEYGNQSGQLDESAETRPTLPYALAKDTLRRQLEQLQQTRPFNLTWARLFYMYGDGQSSGSLWPQLERAARAGHAGFAMSSGEQLRDYLAVRQVAGYLVSLAETERNNGIVNVCSGAPISIKALVEGWIHENGWSIRPDFGRHPYPDYEPMAFWGSVRKLHAVLSAVPSPQAG
jgi:nucleoside-diphosphate-sugar epimerase